MKFSVIVPIYNLENYIHKCVDSILNQTHSDFELILLNDGSTDDSLSICNRYAKKDKRIRVIDKPNEGISSTRNRGIYEAVNEYLYFVDGDDWIHPSTLESYQKLLDIHNKLDIIYGRMSMFFDGSEDLKIDEFNVPDEIIASKTGKESFIAIIDHLGFIRLGVRGLYRKEFLIKNKIFFQPNIYSEDVDWMMNCILKAEKCASNNFPCYNYRARRPGSLVNTPSTKKALDVINIYRHWIKEADQENDIVFKQYFLNEIAERFVNTFIEFTYQFIPMNVNMNEFHKMINKNRKIIKRSNRKKTLIKGSPLLLLGSRITAQLFYRIKKRRDRNADPSYF